MRDKLNRIVDAVNLFLGMTASKFLRLSESPTGVALDIDMAQLMPRIAGIPKTPAYNAVLVWDYDAIPGTIFTGSKTLKWDTITTTCPDGTGTGTGA